MKYFLLILINLILCIQINAQSESCLAVANELTKQKDVWTDQEAIDYVLSNKDSFDFEDEVDKYCYNLALGTRYYSLKKYQKAIVCLREVTMTYDKYAEQMNLSSNPQLLIAYYWEANCELNIGSSKELILQKLNRAKSVFEKFSLQQTDTYNQIVKDLDVLDSGVMDLLRNIPLIMNYVMSGKHNDAIPLIEQIINNWPKSRLKEDVFPYYQLLGNSYIEVGRLNDAEQLYLGALSILDQDNNEQHETYRYFCDALGVLYSQVHNYQKAKDYSGKSKWLHEKYMDFDDSYIRCLSNCALAEIGLGNNYIAKIFMDVALKYFKKSNGNSTIDQVVNSIESLTSLIGDNNGKVTMSDNVDKAFSKRPYIQMLSNAAIIYQQAGFWDDAVMCIKECIALSEEIGEPNGLVYNNLGTLYLYKSKIKDAVSYISKAIPLCTTDYEKNEVLFNYALALWLLRSNECSDIAIQTSKSLTNSITSNFSFLSQEEKYNYYTHFENYLPFLNLILYEEGDENQYGYIYDNILTTKGLLLRASNDIKETIMKSGNKELIEDYDQMISLRQQILTEHDSIHRMDIAKQIEILDKKLSRSAANYGAFTKFNNINWKHVLKSLSDDDIAIEFYNIPIMQRCDTLENINGEPRYCAVILKKGFSSPQIVPLCKETELMDIDSDSLYCSDVLYSLIWKPLQAELKGVKNIYFSADRELHHIAVEYAQMQDGKKMDECYNLYRLSSTRVLVENHNKTKAKNAVLYGGLLYDLNPEQLIAESRNGDYHSDKVSRAMDLSELRYGVKYLPGTKDEVEKIHNSFLSNGNVKSSIITDIKGTEESFKSLASKNIGIIHLATHGFYWSEEDAEERNYVSFLSNIKNKKQNYEDMALLRSGLFFSGANIGLAGESLPDDVEDGVLTAKELSTMNLGNVDMVVMSACQSGLGETTGEGVFGLQRGFKLAGANTLLMSLWKVDDEATKVLMTEFYKNYLSGKTKRESLSLAQKTLRTTYPEPEYWAAFILLDALY